MRSFVSNLPVLANPETTRLMDKAAIDFGVPEIMLMENAARAALNALEQNFGELDEAVVWLFMGNGNNGGDAAALARALADRGARPALFCLKNLDQYSGSPAVNLDLARRDNVPIVRIDASSAAEVFARVAADHGRNPSIIVDGLLGTGFSGTLKPELAEIIGKINDFSRINRVRVLALDIPSGLNAISGQASPVAIRADITVAFAADKPGLCLGGKWTGDVFVRDVGFPRAIYENTPRDGSLLDGRALLSPSSPIPDSYKNIYGHVMLAGGAPGMGGAICLSALAALRAGAGLVTVCAPSATVAQARAFAPEIMTIDLGETWPDELQEETLQAITVGDALVVGPGMGEGAENLLTAILSAKNRPAAVIDADALKIISRVPKAKDAVGRNDILTPHPGEAATLLGETHTQIQNDRARALSDLTKSFPAVCVLKGANTRIGQIDSPPILCPYDLSRLAIAGAGDVLAGCVGALLGRRDNASSIDAAAKGVILHAMAAVMLAGRFPERGVLAHDIADAIPHVETWIGSLDKTALKRGLSPWPRSL